MTEAPEVDHESGDDSPLGEVAVRSDATEHAVTGLEQLDGQVFVDLDSQKPHVTVPPCVDVSYRNDSLEADGGVPTDRREVVMRGVGLGEQTSLLAIALSVVLLLSAGAMGSTDELIAFVMALAGLALGYLGTRSRFSDLSPLEAGDE